MQQQKDWHFPQIEANFHFKTSFSSQEFYDISNLLTFQMSYIYHQVAILAYKILIKNICIINTEVKQL